MGIERIGTLFRGWSEGEFVREDALLSCDLESNLGTIDPEEPGLPCACRSHQPREG